MSVQTTIATTAGRYQIEVDAAPDSKEADVRFTAHADVESGFFWSFSAGLQVSITPARDEWRSGCADTLLHLINDKPALLMLLAIAERMDVDQRLSENEG